MRTIANEMSNEIDVLDEHGLRTGEVLPRAEVHRLGKPHRAVHLYLFDRSNRLLLQRRSHLTDHYPGAYTISLVAHVDAGESSAAAVQREVQEELGIDASGLDFEFLFSYRRDAELSPTYVDRQLNDVYACWTDFRLDDLRLSSDVSEVRLVSIDEFQVMAEQGTGDLAPVYADEWRDVRYLLKHRFARDDGRAADEGEGAGAGGTVFYLVRHGAAEWDIARQRRLKGWGIDLVPLTAEGVEQVESVGARLRREDCRVIIASPMTRAVHSAAILSRLLDLPLHVEFDLHEWVADASLDWEFDFAAVAAALEDRDRLGGEWPHNETRPWEPISSLRRRVSQALVRYAHFQRVIAVCHEEVIFALTGQRVGEGQVIRLAGSKLMDG